MAFSSKTRIALSIGVALTSTTVLSGWVAGIRSIVQIDRSFAPMQFNTALCLAMLSLVLGLRTTSLPQNRCGNGIIAILTLLPLLLAGATGAEYALMRDFGIDRLLNDPFLVIDPATPGRMSPSTSLALLLTSTAALVLSLKRGEQTALLAASLAVLAALVAGSTLIVYLHGLETAPSWQGFTNTAPHTALSLLAISLIAFLDASEQLRQVGPYFLLWQGALTYSFGIALSLILWFAASTANSRHVADALARAARVRAAVLQTTTTNSIDALRSVERFYAGSEQVDEKEFVTFTQHYFGTKHAFVAIDWAPRVVSEHNPLQPQQLGDVHFPVTFTYPTTFPISALGVDHYSDPRLTAWMDEAARTGLPTSSQLLRLSRLPSANRKDDDVLVFVPAYTNGEIEAPNGILTAADPRVRGFVVGLFRLTLLADRAFSGFPEGSPRALLYNEGDNAEADPLFEYPPPAPESTLSSIETSIHQLSAYESFEFGGKRYTLKFTPTKQFYDRFASNMPLAVLLLSLLSTIVAATLLNLNGRRRAEIEESNERFRSAFENASHGMALLGTDGRWINVNAPLATITGYSREELLGRTFKDITHPEDLIGEVAAMQQLLNLERSCFQREKRYIRKDGTVVPVRVNASIVQNEYHKPLYIIAQIQDISDQQEAEAKLRQATRDAESASQIKSEFLANMSHEIRTPLTAILGFTEELLDPTLSDAERVDLTETVLRNSQHLLDIVNDILDFSKIEAGKLTVLREPTDVFELLEFIERALRSRAEAKGLTFVTEYCFPIPRVFKTDPLRIKQILLNLVGNAIKFTERGGVRVLVSYDQAAAIISFAISDTGIGIKQTQRETLFHSFSQADSSTTKRFGGTGLGLVISRRLAELLEGEIMVESVYEQGSTFALRLKLPPVTPEALCYQHESGSRTNSPAGQSVKQFSGNVLLVEDGPDNQKLIRRLLRKSGLTVEIAENGRLAVARALSGHFHLVLMDMQMPELDGYAATAKLIEQGFSAPIVACTADASEENRHRLASIGCADILLKPFTATELFAILSRHLQSTSTGNGAKLSEAELSELRHGYLNLLVGRLDELRRAEESQDLPDIAQHAHRLSGAGMFGFTELSALAHSVQSAAKSGDPKETRSLLKQLYQLCDELFAEVPVKA